VPYATTHDLEIHYELHGDGPPLLVVSGTGNDLRTSRPDLWPLNDAFTCLHYDQRFLGQTGGINAPATMTDYGNDAAALMDAIGWERADVIGTSFGGMVAQHLAIDHPERVGRLVLACTSSGGAGGASADLLALDGLDPLERGIRHLELLDTRSDPRNGVMPRGLEDFIATRMQDAGEADQTTAALARRQLEARNGHDTFGRLSGISAPTLVIGGRYDGLAPVANLEVLADQIPGAEIVLCDGGHLFMLQDPTAFDTIRRFLTS
jgi:3-oxoadipate enol-lactonase